mmetsp:Transcript_33888/g.105256  ORF Transcript_33888/g.105256 Transcript_33888/m.105256 type:complete len:350 (+) Transcript_33888:199-1248(+)
MAAQQLGHVDVRPGLRVREVHGHHNPTVGAAPGPDDQSPGSLAADGAGLPAAPAELQRLEKTSEGRLHLGVRALRPAAPELHGQALSAALLLPPHEHPRARECQGGHGGREGAGPEVRGRPVLVMVLREVAQSPLGHQLVAEDVPAQLVHVALRQAVVERLVVHGLEALADELQACPARVDLVVLVALGEGQEAGEALANARQHPGPELGAGLAEALLPQQGAPRALDNGVAAEHRHVNAHGVAPRGDGEQFLRHVLAAHLGPIVELSSVGPIARVRITPEQRAVAALDEEARQTGPGAVAGHVVRHEVEHQAAAACGQPLAEGCKVAVQTLGSPSDPKDELSTYRLMA